MNAKRTILIVEDDKPLLDLYTKKFEKEGFHVLQAEDGQAGVDQATNNLPDIILLDIMLPVMNGFEVLKRLKANDKTCGTPIVILSNYGEMPNITEGLMGGAVEYLIKVEHTPEEVLEVVTDALAEQESLIGKAFKETAS